MPSNEQRRQAAKRKLERQLARRAERAKRRRVLAVSVTVGAVVVVVGLVYLLVALNSGDDAPAASEPTPSDAPSKTTEGPCGYASTPSEPAAKPVVLPADPKPTPNTGTVKVTLKTNQGEIPVTIDRAKAPCNAQGIEHLVKAKFYDGTPCHRMTTGGEFKVLQCGDPAGTGSGGPGYTMKDEKPADLKPAPTNDGRAVYPKGTLAMAKTQAPNSAGSQFFMVYGDTHLAPDYSVFGTIDAAGLQTIEKIAAGGINPANSEQDGSPKNPVTIESAAVVG